MFSTFRSVADRLPFVLLSLLALILAPAVSTAREPLRCEMKVLSEKLRDKLKERRTADVAIGDVIPADANTPGSSGPGIRKVLIEEMDRAQIKVKLLSDVSLSISYRQRTAPLKNDRKIEQLVVEMRITASFTTDNSQEDILTHCVDNPEAVLQILGGSALIGPKRGKERAAETVAAVTRPATHFDDTIVLSGEKADFGMEILVDDKPVKPFEANGRGMVKLEREQTYAIRLVNRSALEMSVRLSVDGLSIFAFSDVREKDGPYKGAPLYDVVLVPPRDSITIKGWHKDNSTVRKFKLTEYADTAAAKLNKATDIGTITATFCAAWEKTPPDDEPDGSRGPGDDGTGFGEPIAMKYTPVQRTIGAVRACVSVRYKVPPGK